MSLVKVCPSCGCQNDLSNSLCNDCMADISGVSPIDAEAPVPEEPDPQRLISVATGDSSATVVERRKSLRFEAADGSGGFTAVNGATIGREGEGKEYLSVYTTVSRHHARLTFDGTWNVEDMNSTNGVWVNERRVGFGERCPIKAGDRIALSHSCVLIVKE